MPLTQSDLLPELCRVKVRAARTAFWLGIATAATLSSDPAPCGLARWKNAATPATMSTPAVASRRTLTGGRLRLAVPNSSPMLMVGPGGIAGGVGDASGLEVAGGIGAGMGTRSGMSSLALSDSTPDLP